MTAGKSFSWWALISILLVVVIIGGMAVIWMKHSPHQYIEIFMTPEREQSTDVYVGGAISNPGWYPLRSTDSLGDIIGAAGGVTDNADSNRLVLTVPALTDEQQPQKVDINRAEVWLLAALPGIGEGRAQAIIEYRQKNGPFRNINGLLRVEGIGPSVYDKIKQLISVGD